MPVRFRYRPTSLVLVAVLLAFASGAAATLGTGVDADYRPVLDRYCVTCHNQKLKTAGLTLETVDVSNPAADAATWEKVIRKLRAFAMPPAGALQLDKATNESFVRYLENTIDQAAEARVNPGKTVVHRLNREEYANAVRDLVGLEIDPSTLLPADDGAYGFDNIGTALAVSPALIERYLLAAEKISRQAIPDFKLPSATETYRLSASLNQDELMGERQAFGTRGGAVIRHYFPLDGEYEFNIRLQRSPIGEILGIEYRREIELRLDGARVKLFSVGGAVPPLGAAAREYIANADKVLDIRLPVPAGSHEITVSYLRDSIKSEATLREGNVNQKGAREGIASIEIIGPFQPSGLGDTASRRKIFSCYPKNSGEEDACAQKILSNLARRAFRQPVHESAVLPLFNLFKNAREKGDFEASIRTAVEGLLSSPGFLFRGETDPAGADAGAAHKVSGVELASRLSFFLWSSIPDEELLQAAETGKLNDPAVLETQTRRMLADPKASKLISNFFGQWLFLRNLRLKAPDTSVFPDFDESLRQAFEKETQLFVESVIREDRSILDLLDAEYTFVNERLARFYGIPNVYGTRFRRVALTDPARRGILGQGSILTVTSYNTRTSPTLRGKWVLENIMGTPPPPPPPNVPSLKDDKAAKSLTMRQRMELHRANPACASCHARMDPLGFALENFDAIGKWQTVSGLSQSPIDASGVWPDGSKFNGPAELRAKLLENKIQFAHALTEKLMTYALGRGLDYADQPVIRKILRAAEKKDYRWSALVQQIVASAPFQMRTVTEP